MDAVLCSRDVGSCFAARALNVRRVAIQNSSSRHHALLNQRWRCSGCCAARKLGLDAAGRCMSIAQWTRKQTQLLHASSDSSRGSATTCSPIISTPKIIRIYNMLRFAILQSFHSHTFFIIICIMSVFLSVFLPVRRNKGVHYNLYTIHHAFFTPGSESTFFHKSYPKYRLLVSIPLHGFQILSDFSRSCFSYFSRYC